METNDVLMLPVSGAGCGDVRITYEALSVLVEFECRASGGDYVGAVRFNDVIAFRFRDENHSAGFIGRSYDRVIDLGDSNWMRELRAMEPPGTVGVEGKRHFAVLLSSNGYLEVLAGVVSHALSPPVRHGISPP